MKKTILLYGLGLGGVAIALQWLEYQYSVRRFATEIYIVVIAVVFTALGIWAGNRLTRGHVGTIQEPRFEVPGVVILGLFCDPADNPMDLVEMDGDEVKIP